MEQVTDEIVLQCEVVIAWETDIQAMCRRLAEQSGDRVGVVDVVLWYAGSKGIIPGISRLWMRRSGRCSTAVLEAVDKGGVQHAEPALNLELR